MNSIIFAGGVWQTLEATVFNQIKSKEVIFGSAGKSVITSQNARVLENALGAKLRIIYGYKGTKWINLATRCGKVNGSCGLSISTVRAH
ncbi:hypothetical protein OAJ57_01815 [Alphaproteobacteria bacterium]|nr:hypothetical protein [Alphaproteobacteria bacterium]